MLHVNTEWTERHYKPIVRSLYYELTITSVYLPSMQFIVALFFGAIWTFMQIDLSKAQEQEQFQVGGTWLTIGHTTNDFMTSMDNSLDNVQHVRSRLECIALCQALRDDECYASHFDSESRICYRLRADHVYRLDVGNTRIDLSQDQGE